MNAHLDHCFLKHCKPKLLYTEDMLKNRLLTELVDRHDTGGQAVIMCFASVIDDLLLGRPPAYSQL